jgi:hypothetical protein
MFLRIDMGYFRHIKSNLMPESGVSNTGVSNTGVSNTGVSNTGVSNCDV